MNVINTKDYGHLVKYDDFNPQLTSPDFYTLLSNKHDWEQRYIHPEYYDQFKPNYTHKQVRIFHIKFKFVKSILFL